MTNQKQHQLEDNIYHHTPENVQPAMSQGHGVLTESLLLWLSPFFFFSSFATLLIGKQQWPVFWDLNYQSYSLSVMNFYPQPSKSLSCLRSRISLANSSQWEEENKATVSLLKRTSFFIPVSINFSFLFCFSLFISSFLFVGISFFFLVLSSWLLYMSCCFSFLFLEFCLFLFN